MTANSEEYYKNKIADLQKEVRAREEDLRTFREQLASANQKLEILIEQFNGQIKIVQAIQKVLVPTQFQNIKGIDFSYKFVPSMVSGGDYFDIFEHEDRFCFGLVIASGTGYSMSSLLLSVLLKLTGKLEARKGIAPHKVVELINNELSGFLAPKDQADLFYAVVDRRTFELKFNRLGSVTALHLDYGSGQLNVLEPDGEGLAAGFLPPKASQTLTLNPRDRLILCTRGVEETQNLEGEKFGVERLFDAVLSAPKSGVHELRNEIMMRLSKFAQGCEVKRDQTVLIAEVKDRVITLAKIDR